jgi:hypothetical protein
VTKAKISQYDPSAGNNTDVNGVNINEGCAPSGINNAIREVMAALKRFETGADGDSVTVGGNLVVSGTATLSTALPVASGGTGGTTSTGSGAVVLATSPTLVTPALGTPTAGVLSSCTVDGTDAVGFRNTPVNSQSTDYTAVAADAGKTIFHPASDANDRTFTIPANSSVAYAVGTVLTFVNLSANDLTIDITTDTMYLAGDGDTGSRTLAEYGIASAVKLASTDWLISGNNLT